VFTGTLEVDPAFVEAVDHADARHGVLHALRAEAAIPRMKSRRRIALPKA
jgi:hypothetical protein